MKVSFPEKPKNVSLIMPGKTVNTVAKLFIMRYSGIDSVVYSTAFKLSLLLVFFATRQYVLAFSSYSLGRLIFATLTLA